MKMNKTAETIAAVFEKFGKVYNGFEVTGEENIPLDRPALIVFYHSIIPLEAWYFGSYFYRKNKKLIRGLGDNWLFKTPGVNWLVRSFGAIPGNYEAALKLLKEGELVGVSPGGVREAISGTGKRYELVWGERKGFAKLAIEAGVEIIPAFGENAEELYRSPFSGKKFFQNLYEKTRLPLVPIMGLGALPFPVKLIVHIGEPIKIEAKDTAEEVVGKTKRALESLILNHQKKDITVTEAIQERVKDLSKK